MKFTVMMKDPDGVSESINEAAKESLSEVNKHLSAGEQEAMLEARRETIGVATKRWFKWGEYLTVEIDTEAGTCTVVETR